MNDKTISEPEASATIQMGLKISNGQLQMSNESDSSKTEHPIPKT